MSLEYPLEQICSHKSEPFQLGFARDAIALLSTRSDTLLDAERIGPLGIVRATAPLASLLGFARDLTTLTSGNASQVMWFSHYAPVRSVSTSVGI